MLQKTATKNLIKTHFIQLSNDQLEICSLHNQLFLLRKGEFSWCITRTKKLYDTSIVIIKHGYRK